MADNVIRHRYTVVVEYDTIGDEVAVFPDDIEADALHGGLHNYYGVTATVVRGPEEAK